MFLRRLESPPSPSVTRKGSTGGLMFGGSEDAFGRKALFGRGDQELTIAEAMVDFGTVNELVAVDQSPGGADA